jgi:hypothetical protein
VAAVLGDKFAVLHDQGVRGAEFVAVVVPRELVQLIRSRRRSFEAVRREILAVLSDDQPEGLGGRVFAEGQADGGLFALDVEAALGFGEQLDLGLTVA